MPDPCPLCGGASSALLEDAKSGWRYAACGVCELAFRTDPPLPPDEERRRYALHENRPDDGYRRFLEPAAAAVAARCAPGAEGLDYGCGPGPVLALMLGERGFKTALYDPHFAPSPLALARRYDFVTCTEAAEHFEEPAKEFETLDALLAPAGWLALMTRLRDGEDFARWHYRQDPTHRRFYCEATLRWLARRHGWRLERPAPHLALFRRDAVVASL
jgi:SAM-dependent methyltransferase